jgi:hypothetical protein
MYSIYLISCYSSFKSRFEFNYAACRVNIYEYDHMEKVTVQPVFTANRLQIIQSNIQYLISAIGAISEHI